MYSSNVTSVLFKIELYVNVMLTFSILRLEKNKRKLSIDVLVVVSRLLFLQD